MPEQDPEQGTALEQEWLCGRGEAADRIRCLDWSSTPLGPRATWPHSLRTLVNLLLAQPLPMLLLWGPELVQIYNDGYLPIAGHRHPRAMGQPTRECWPEAWPEDELLYARLLATGEPICRADQRRVVERNGRREEGRFTLTYSPVCADSGGTAGILITLIETTARVAAEERRQEAVAQLLVARKELRRERRATAATRRADHRSNERFRELANAMPQLVWTARPDGTVDYYNDRVCEFEGIRQDADGNWIWEPVLHPDDVQRTLAAWEHAVRTGTPYQMAHRVRRADGTYRWYLSRGVPARDAAGHIIRWYGTATDIHDQKEAEEGLRRYELLSAHSRDIILFMRRDNGQILEANDAATLAYGYSRDELRGMLVHELRAPGTEVLTEEQMAQADAHGILFETVHRRRDGTTFPVEVSSRGATIGGVRTLISVVRDITERKSAEARLHFLVEASRVLASSLDYGDTLGRVARLALPDVADHTMVDLVETDGTVTRALTAHADPAKQWLADSLRRYPPNPTQAQGVPAVLRTGRSLLVPDVTEETVRAITQNEEHRRLVSEMGLRSLMIVPLAVGGHVLGALSLASDRPGRRYDAEDLALAEDLGRRAGLAIENARLYAEAQQAKAAAEAANQAKDQFVAIISHELRNPLNAITAGVGFLRQSCAGDRRTERAVEIVERNTALQARLINDLLDLSRLQRGKLQLRHAPLRLDQVVEVAAQAQVPEAAKAGLTLTWNVAPGLLMLGDADRLQQVVMNLLANAIKFTPAGGRVWVEAEECSERGTAPAAGRKGCITVVDTGIGIDPDELDYVFDMFRQGGAADKGTTPGLGLGLALVKGIVERHGGRVWAESEGIGKGSRFTVELPLVDIS